MRGERPGKDQRSLMTLFVLSWLPHIIVLILSVAAMINGVGWLFGKVYGFDAFVIVTFAILYYTWPLFLATTAYQVYSFIKLRRARLGESDHPENR